MPAPIQFYFDFASPYAYLAARPIEALAARHGRTVEWKPILLWAVMKALDLPPPFATPVRSVYMRKDVARSAAYLGTPLRMPSAFAKSSHLPARLYYALAAEDSVLAARFLHGLFEAHFTEDLDLSDAAGVAKVTAACGSTAEAATAAMQSADAKARLATAVDEAVQQGVWGSPLIIVDGEHFFGADRLPQIEWSLSAKQP